MSPKYNWSCCESENTEAVSKRRHQNQAGVISSKRERIEEVSTSNCQELVVKPNTHLREREFDDLFRSSWVSGQMTLMTQGTGVKDHDEEELNLYLFCVRVSSVHLKGFEQHTPF